MEELLFSRYRFKWPIKIEIKTEFLKCEPEFADSFEDLEILGQI